MSSAKGIHIVDAESIAITNSRFDPAESPVLHVAHGRTLTLRNVNCGAARPLAQSMDSSDVQDLRVDVPVKVDTTLPWSERIAQSFLLRHPGAVTYDSIFTQTSWNYEQGLMLLALERLWLRAGDVSCRRFVLENLDHFIREDGSIATYSRTDYNLDNISAGRVLLDLVAAADGKFERYRRASDTLRQQLREQPRTDEGGFWHKKIYPSQMWLDGLFMAEPFYAKYAVMFHDSAAVADVIRQFRLVTRHTRDNATGLLFHGYDERRVQRWADKTTGRSPCFWARAIGWYAMALVEVLDILPANTVGRGELLGMLRQTAAAIAGVQDSTSGVWYQVIDRPGQPGNYLEASASAMFTYVFARGAARGYLEPSYAGRATRAFQGMMTQFVSVDSSGYVNLLHTCKGAGLGGTPYRDGSYDYYVHETQRMNDLKGLGAFLLAAIELETKERVQ